MTTEDLSGVGLVRSGCWTQDYGMIGGVATKADIVGFMTEIGLIAETTMSWLAAWNIEVGPIDG